MGFDEVVATRMARDETGRLTGRITGRSCYDIDKLRAVQAYLGDSLNSEPTTFYSDSLTDLPLLEQVDNAVVVNPSRKLRVLAKRRGFTIANWR